MYEYTAIGGGTRIATVYSERCEIRLLKKEGGWVVIVTDLSKLYSFIVYKLCMHRHLKQQRVISNQLKTHRCLCLLFTRTAVHIVAVKLIYSR
jgi:hypothetical protein